MDSKKIGDGDMKKSNELETVIVESISAIPSIINIPISSSSNNNNKLKIALLVSGKLARTSESDLDHFLNRVVVPNNADVFVVSQGEFDVDMFRRKLGPFLKTYSYASMTHLANDVYQLSERWSTHIKNSEYTPRRGSLHLEQRNDQFYMVEPVVCQQAMLRLVWNQCLQYETHHGFLYDRIARSRVDNLTYTSTIPMNFPVIGKFISCYIDTANDEGPALPATVTEKWFGYDFLFFGTRNEVWKVMEHIILNWGVLRPSIETRDALFAIGENDLDFIPEVQIALSFNHIIKTTNATHIPFPKCKRIKNDQQYSFGFL